LVDTLNLDPEQASARLTPRTKAILPVDYAGHPADLKQILEIAESHGLIVIEDACHALGAEFEGQRVGSLSHMTVFSFHPVKHLTTGEGGMVTTDRADLADTLRKFRNHGIDTDARQRQASGQWHYDMVMLGFNYRLTDIGCALGIEQLKRLESNLARRRQIAACYSAAFRDVRGVTAPTVRPNTNPAWHLYPIRVGLAGVTMDRGEVFRALRAENIGVNVHYVPVHKHRYYRDCFGFRGGEFPVAEKAYEHLISLPMFHGMTDDDVNDVIRAVAKVVSYWAG
jgi:dTDP-4-amino-4,6-dideoxygalactose transaminase